MAPAMQPAEIQFAQRLASNEKGIRERAVKKLRQYISVKTQRETGGFSQEELLKIWKGLFYCMWMQDEPLLQEELASTISQLIHVVSSSEAQHLFIQTFWQTVNREWKEIDRLRLDKYYMLIRLFLRQSFEALKRNGWEESRVELFLDVLTKEILRPESQSPDGVKLHFIDIYLDELSKVGGKELLADQNLKFIDPFCKIAAKTKDHTLVQTIARGVFEAIVDQSPFIPEEIVEEQKSQVGDSGLSEVEMTWRKTASKKKRALGKYHSRKDGIGEDSEQAGCGTLEDTGPLLQFDYKAVADRLLEITSRKNTPPFNRKRLSKLIKKFQDLSEGSAAQCSFAEDISANKEDHTVSQGRQKNEGNELSEKTGLEKEKGNKFFLSAEERKDGAPKRKRKKKKNSLQPEVPGLGAKAMCRDQNGSRKPEARKSQDPKACAAEVGARPLPSTEEESGLGHPPASPSHKRKRPRKKSLRVQEGTRGLSASPAEGMLQRGPSSEPCQESAAAAPPAGAGQSLKGKRKLGALPGCSSPAPLASPRLGEEGGHHIPLPPSLKPKKRKVEPSSLDLCDFSNQKTAILKRRKKMKEMLNLVEHNGVLETEAKRVQALGNSRTFIPLKKKKLTAEGDSVRFDTPHLPKPLFFRKAKSSAAVSSLGRAIQLNKTPSSSKKVTFGLNRNMTAEFRKTDKSLLVSPTGPSRVAFNPEQRPLHGVLKTPSHSPSSTPPAAKRPLAVPPKRRPTAMDFF